MTTIPLSSPDLIDCDVAAVLEVLCGPRLSLGPKVPAFEQAIAERAGVRHAVAVNSGTSALHLCIKAAGIGEDDEVITTPFSFVASANCVLFENGTPVFVDIDPVTWNMDPGRIEQAITPRTKAILPVHVFGRPCAMDQILEIARRHRLTVIEDACETIGARYKGRPVGSLGQTGVFAFYPNKQLTTGEGGAIVTDDAEVAALCRSWRNQGRGENGGWLQHERLGYNYRLSDINCALGLAQIERLDEILTRRACVAALYTEKIRNIPELIAPADAESETEMSWFVYVVRLQDEFTRQDRDAVLEKLRSRGIECNDYFTPIHLQPFYQSRFGFHYGDFPITESVAERTIALPFYNQLTEAAVERVCRSLREAVHSRQATRAVA
ncbi:MAG: DegT/DnrJ/EryC1/StrS family aminotransferase [Acidobacteria bacterium]|nr:DegT/DnrJ/EryC1/StrS family aminotransferase [Acidobacteriota bacterium]